MPRCRASLEPIISVEFKFVAKQAAASGIIQAAKLKFVNLQKVQHESTLSNMLPHLATLYLVARQVGHKSGNTRMQRSISTCNEKCCETSFGKNVARTTGH